MGPSMTDSWATRTASAGFKAVRDVLVAQKKAWAERGWFEVTPILLRPEGKDNPKLTVNFNTDAPFGVARHPAEYDVAVGWAVPTKRPQIVAAVQGDTLFIAYQTWDRTKPTDKVVIARSPLAEVAKKKLAFIRVVRVRAACWSGSPWTTRAADYVLTAKAEKFPNNPEGDFVDDDREDLAQGRHLAPHRRHRDRTEHREVHRGDGLRGRQRRVRRLAAVPGTSRRCSPAPLRRVRQADSPGGGRRGLFSADLSKVPLKAEQRGVALVRPAPRSSTGPTSSRCTRATSTRWRG